MNRPKIKLYTRAETFNGETRYAVYDHTGTRWHGEKQGMRYDLSDHFYANDLPPETLAYWRTITAETPELAIAQHSPVHNHDILGDDTPITRIKITKSGDKTPSLTYFTLLSDVKTFVTGRDRVDEFYEIIQLSGAPAYIRYALIERIEFEEL